MPMTNIQMMKGEPNQSSIWPRSRRTSRAAEPRPMRAMPMPSTLSLPFLRTALALFGVGRRDRGRSGW